MPDAEQHPSQVEPIEEKLVVASLLKLRAPLGGQEIELQQVDYVHGGSSLLRIRIREGRRFTVFDLDAATSHSWAQAMGEWADSQLRSSECSDGC